MTISPASYSSNTGMPVKSGDIKSRVLQSEVFTIRNSPNQIGLYENIFSYVLNKLRKLSVLKERIESRMIAYRGYIKYIELQELKSIAGALRDCFRPIQLAYLKDILNAVFCHKNEFYYCAESITRIHPPCDFVAKKPEYITRLKSYGGGGKLGIHDPHGYSTQYYIY